MINIREILMVFIKKTNEKVIGFIGLEFYGYKFFEMTLK